MEPSLKRGDLKPGQARSIDGKVFGGYRTHTLKSGEKKEYARFYTPEALARRKTLQNSRANGLLRTKKSVAWKLYSDAKRRAFKKRGSVTISVEWIHQRLENGRSELSGTEFFLPADGSANARAPSLDRIDSSNPDYSPENTRVICFQENVALNNFGDEASLPILEALVEGLKRKLGLDK